MRMERELETRFTNAPQKEIPEQDIIHKFYYTKQFLLKNHQNMQQKTLLTNIIGKITQPDKVSTSKKTVFGKQDLKKYENSYTPIKIHDMAPGVVNRERILYAKAIVDSAMMTSLHTVIEDDYGGACKLCIYNLSSAQIQAFCKDVKMAILNPYYKQTADSMHMMRVDNPMEIILIQPDTPASPFILPKDHKLRGNELYSQDKFVEAVEEYSQAIMGDRHDPLFYSNRSICYTKLSQFEAALCDATAALDIDPTDAKFKCREAQAWSGLGNHVRAIDILGGLVETARNNTLKQEYIDRLNVEQTYLAQQRGEINLKNIEQLVLAGFSVKMGDYIGPLELKLSRCVGCAERGLFATRDIRRGEVIHVSKAAVYLNNYKFDLSGSLEITPTDPNSAVSPPYQILVSKLIQSMNKSKLFAHRVLNITEDKNNPIKPPFYTNIQLYTHTGYEAVRELNSPEFSIENIKNIAVKKAFGSVLKDGNNAVDAADRNKYSISGAEKYGMWFVPSLLNHSCVGNVVRIVKGEILVLKVFKDVRAGEELVMSLFDGSYRKTLGERMRILKNEHGYECHCAMCKYDLEPNIKPILVRVSTLYDQVYDFWCKYAINSPSKIAANHPVEQYRELVARAIELADELGMGPQTFCGAIWSSIINLTCIVTASAKDQLYLFERTERYLSELEVYHQHGYWKNYRLLCMERFGIQDSRTQKAIRNSVSFDKLFAWE